MMGRFFWGSTWGSGGIRCSFSAWVVISINTLPFRSAGFFHSLLCCYLLGNLNPFYVFEACLEGASTILASSAFSNGSLGFSVLWGCTCLGGIRKEITTVVRAFISNPFIFWFFLVPYSGYKVQVQHGCYWRMGFGMVYWYGFGWKTVFVELVIRILLGKGLWFLEDIWNKASCYCFRLCFFVLF
ncbi:hypothetical protein HanPI659440_Chr03g0106451 [Helianthus annuus]|nr:hypothetical protein HanPI659440_Chr03g0106451 [Helianthus annuus]